MAATGLGACWEVKGVWLAPRRHTEEVYDYTQSRTTPVKTPEPADRDCPWIKLRKPGTSF